MEISETRQGAVTVVKPMGPLVQSDAEQFAARIREVMTKSLGRFVVDASAVPYVDSRGLESLLDTSDELAKSGQSLRLCGSTETVREVLELTDLSTQFEYFEDVGSAVRSFL